MTQRVALDGKRVLVIAYGHVADTMAAVPGLRSLRAAYPSARIDALVVKASAAVLEGCPYVDEVVTWDDFRFKGSRFARAEKAAVIAALGMRLRSRRYHAVLVFHRSFRALRQIAALSGAPIRAGVSSGRDGYTHAMPPPGDIHSSREENRAVLASIGVEEDGGGLELWTSAADEEVADRLLPAAAAGPTIGLHPGSDWSCQQWLPDRFAAVGRALEQRLGARIVITGSRSEIGLEQEIARELKGSAVTLAGKTSLGQLAAVVRSLDLLIAVNSAPAAIAQAVGTPSVILLGPEDPRLTGLIAGAKLGLVQPGLRLAPGSWCEFGRWGLLSGCDSPMCRGVAGLDQLEPDEVTRVAIRILNASADRRSHLEVAR